jgi:hypothetical protein
MGGLSRGFRKLLHSILNLHVHIYLIPLNPYEGDTALFHILENQASERLYNVSKVTRWYSQ